MSTESTDRKLTARLNAAIDTGEGIEDVLATLLAEVEGRAIGLWRTDGDELRMVGFAAVDDMAADVQRAFRESTASVSLSLVRFGIVAAAVSREPTLMRAEDATTATAGSPGWLVRFDSVSSLSVPVFAEDDVAGVLAVSSRESFDPSTGNGARLARIANGVVIEAPPHESTREG